MQKGMRMVKYKCYKADELIAILRMFDDFYILDMDKDNSAHVHNPDWVTGEDFVSGEKRSYITSRKGITNVEEFNFLWSETKIYFENGASISLHSENVNREDKSLHRMLHNNFFSPSFTWQDKYILTNKDLDAWLAYNGLFQETLKSTIVEFEVLSSYIFEKADTPIVKDGKVKGHYFGGLTIKEEEMNNALNEISNEEVRFKIKEVLETYGKKISK